ncbi:diaminopimelate epimerase [Ureibacillus sp. FSL K6-8385]|uniref:Diaminopimelate epimerase n=1 Tax=Ureibacillus terrenus TaxID=118246 RepID=A0A540V518_9BACL|nr:diaminopimelate epimerase [Ureibacillus terrenus]MED3662629.1 diaminopimelate epimerase [Ureibacillus terrenus]MED3764919.1 diaminopimelate epimerase [Ureibacillus terrenus]TQE91850.1 diaminopimelate epimerase [Ureibacillus terrenus]
MLFTKMHGLGNNYIFINLLENTLEEDSLPTLARNLSDVRFGIGSDGMILICDSKVADFRMRIFNADGSEGKNCGNGLRCVAKYLYDHQFVDSESFTIETLGGIVEVHISEKKKEVEYVTVDMGEPKLLKTMIPMIGEPMTMTINEPFEIGGNQYRLTCVSMGNPHAIMFVDDVHKVPLDKIGPMIEHSDIFPERVNVGVVAVKKPNELDYRVWERGSGITMACGTGACAAVVAATLNNKIEKDQSITVHLPGGDLEIRWDENNHVWMKGKAEYICHGEFKLEDFTKEKLLKASGE